MGDLKKGLAGWCAATVLVSAFLLFQVQPMVSKMILPWFGGGPAVWTTCMLFFQLFLLAGYTYAHLLDRLPSTRYQGMIHLVLLIAALVVLPILPDSSWKPVDSAQPQWRILVLLAANVGLPYFLLAASAPLVQAWYARAFHGQLPYRFYALSNFGSLAALLSYPFLIEPMLAIPSQSTLWSSTFAGFALLSGGLAVGMWRWNLPAEHTIAADGEDSPTNGARLSLARCLLWLLLPAFGSMSLLAFTNQICQDVAVVPFFWVVPLSIYLITFIICFDSERWYFRTLTSVGTMVVIVIIAGILLSDRIQPLVDWMHIDYTIPEFLDSLAMEVVLFLAALFLICMLCHGELVRSKPGARHLTLFYLMISAGGALGGLFVALVCPQIFSGLFESDLCLIGGFLMAAFISLHAWSLRERRWWSWWLAWLRLPVLIVRDLALLVVRRRQDASLEQRQDSILRLGRVARRRRRWWTLWSVPLPIPIFAVLVLVVMIPRHDDRSNVLVARRNFYGVLSVAEYGDQDGEEWRRNLYNGRILHGIQLRQPERRREPTTYYSLDSGVGLTLRYLARVEPLRVATVGLGTGTVAAYGEPGDYYCFYEINPAVEQIAREYFTFVTDSQADVTVKLGDARLTMEHESSQNYDVIALDAFSGDAIPAHLLTVEAFAVYLRHLKPSGVIAVHTSNRHLNLPPIVALLAGHYDMRLVAVNSDDAGGAADSSAEWLLVTRNLDFLSERAVFEASAPVAAPDPSIRVWTDQYSNLFQILTMWDEWGSDEDAAESEEHEEE